MQVYGDHSRRVDPRALLDEIAARWSDLSGRPAGIERHAALVSVFITAGELLQGLADASLARLGHDEIDPASALAAGLCRTVASAVAASWDGDEAEPPSSVLQQVETLRSLDLPPHVEVKLAEGYAFYALYPEVYLEAARALSPAEDLQAIGLRSIGAGLSAVVAAAVGGPDPVTVRPIGHPFDRRLQLGPKLGARLASAARVAVVDEGPGLSGSSFGAAQAALSALSVDPGRISLFPSHSGEPGAAAGAERRAAYLAADRRLSSFEDVLLSPGRLASWVEDLTGPAAAPLEDVSGGGWRTRLLPDAAAWPPVWAQQERRKYLLRSAEGVFLLRFAGLGVDGERRFALARDLGAAGWSNAPLGFRHGFIVERWLEGALPLTAADGDRGAILERLAGYLAWRDQRTQPAAYNGASISALFGMLQGNIDQAGGEGSSALVEIWRPRLAELQAHVRPVAIDGRLQPWEWLRTCDGRLLKADAVDHHLAHDLVGPQDIAWDIAGAAVEFGLSEQELAALRREVGRETGRPPSPLLVEFLSLAYAAFQIGRCAMAQQTSAADDGARLEMELRRYLDWLNTKLGA